MGQHNDLSELENTLFGCCNYKRRVITLFIRNLLWPITITLSVVHDLFHI